MGKATNGQSGKWTERQMDKAANIKIPVGTVIVFVIEGRAGDACGPGPMVEGKAYE